MIYSTTDWLEIEENCLSDEFLIEVFVKDIHKNVYVSKKGIIKGIVSHGDFCRHIIENKPLIQWKFTSGTVQDEETAKEILQSKANIYGIPALNEEGRIIREWRKEVKEEDAFSNYILFELYEQFLSDRDGYFNILVMDLSSAEDAEVAKKINEGTVGKLLIIDKKDILNINKYFVDIKPGIVYDNRKKYASFIDIVYKKLEVDFELLKKVNITEDVINHILEFYGSTGILGSEAVGLSDEYKQKESVCIFDNDKFVWNEAKDCFEYKGYIESDKVPETLWVSCCILKNPYIICKEKVIPIISGEYPIREKYAYTTIKGAENKASDYDIVYNIIPKLNENNINFIILCDSDNDFGQIKGFDIKEAEKRTINFPVGYLKTCPNSFFNLDGSVFVDEMCKELSGSTQGWNKRGYKELRDFKGKYINMSQGKRLVLGNPTGYKHKIWLFGPCLIRGGLVDDASNMGSVLKKKIDNNYYVQNMGAMYETRNLCIRDAELSEKDIVVIQAYDNSIYENAGIKIYSLLDIYNKCPNVMEHIVDVPSHADAYLTEKIAERVYEILVSSHMLETYNDDKRAAEAGAVKQIRMRKERDNINVPQGLRKWLSGIQSYKGEDFSRTGAIVMNCNPFTLGHRYLIEQACGQVDKLLIFVLEEDKSFFKFEDRIEMVRLGTRDLDKVSVIPSGRYIISSETLPGYFEKEDNPEIVLDATDDLDFFVKVIAKELNISVRFAGEEPLDGYTRQYNQAMSKVLPQNYIDFVEIPRKEQGGSVISASRVRKLMKEKNYEDIQKLVLPQVYEYLTEHYFSEINIEEIGVAYDTNK